MDNRKLLVTGNLALFLILGYIILRAVSNFCQVQDLSTPPAASGQMDTARHEQVDGTPSKSYSNIGERNLFHPAAEAGSAESKENRQHHAAVDDTALFWNDYKLIGTISGSSGIARAILKNIKDNTTTLYKIGDLLAGGYIEHIERQGIILNCQGQRIKMQLTIGQPLDKPSAGQVAGAGDKSPYRDRPETQPLVSTDNRPAAGVQGLETLLDTAVEENFDVNNQSDIPDHQPTGLRIGDMDQLSQFSLTGLRTGDVILAINGQQVNSKPKAFQILQKARTQPTLDLLVLRDKEEITVSFAQQETK